MNLRKKRWFGATLLILAGLALSACGAALNADAAPGPDDPSQQAEIEFFGIVEAIGDAEWVVDGLSLEITAETEIKGAIEVGDLVKVHAFARAGTALVAREIEPAALHMEDEDPGDDEFEFFGVVDAQSDDAWVIDGRSVLITPQTEIKGAIAVGDPVKVHAFFDPAGLLTAREIEPAMGGEMDDEVFDELGEIEFFGVVGSIGATEWVVAGQTLLITRQTEIKGLIQIGDLVKVHAFPSEGGALVAREIEPAAEHDDDDFDDPDNEVEFEGIVESMGGSVWVIAGRQVTVTPNTELEDDVQVGDMVEVEAIVDQDGNLIALEIELEDEDRSGRSHQDDDDDDDHDDEDDHDHDHDDDDDDHDDDNSGPGGGDDD